MDGEKYASGEGRLAREMRLGRIVPATGLATGCETGPWGEGMARVEIFRGQARRRWSDEEKRRLVAETFMPGETVHAVAQRHGVNTSQLFTWRKRFRAQLGLPAPAPGMPAFAAVEVAPVSLSPEAPARRGHVRTPRRLRA